MFSANSEDHHSQFLATEEALAITKASVNREAGSQSSPFSHFPSAPNHIDSALSSLHHYFSQQHVAPSDANFASFAAPDQTTPPKSRVNAKGVDVVDPVKSKKVSPRKRMAGKKDRHSKIRTLQGLRDRRIRLSVQVSRRFFDLQDMLGFDKASKTIEWLLSKSRSSIKELDGNVTKQRDRASDGKAAQLEVEAEHEEEEEEEEDFSSREEKLKSCDASEREKARERAKERMATRGINPDTSEMAGGDGFYAHQQAINNDDSAQEYGQFTSEMDDSLNIIDKFLGDATAATSSAEMANYFPETSILCPAIRRTDLLAGFIQEFDGNSFIWPRTEP